MQNLLRHPSRGRFAFLLCAALSPADGICLPSDATCTAILQAQSFYEAAIAVCPFTLSTVGLLPGTLLGCLARSTGCTLSPHHCITLQLKCAVSAPAAVFPVNPTVGWIVDMDMGFVGASDGSRRIVALCNHIASNAPPICELHFKRQTVYLSLIDSVTAARARPYHIAELRAILTRGPFRKYLKRWCLDNPPPTNHQPQPTTNHLRYPACIPFAKPPDLPSLEPVFQIRPWPVNGFHLPNCCRTGCRNLFLPAPGQNGLNRPDSRCWNRRASHMRAASIGFLACKSHPHPRSAPIIAVFMP